MDVQAQEVEMRSKSWDVIAGPTGPRTDPYTGYKSFGGLKDEKKSRGGNVVKTEATEPEDMLQTTPPDISQPV